MNDWFEAEQRVERAQQLLESQRFAEALAEIDVALSINPNNAAWHAQRGFLLEELGEAAEAAGAFESSLAIEPGDRDVAAALGHALLHMERHARAIQVFDEIARLYPDFEPAYCARIHAFAELGQHDQAEQMFYLAQEIDDACPHCFYHVGSSLAARGLHEKAIFCWQRVLELEPDYLGVNRRIGQSYRAQGRLSLARDYLLREIREDAGNTDLMFELAELTLESGDVAQAAAKFVQIVELEPDHIEARFALGQIWLQSGQPAQALACFEEIGTIAEDDPELEGYEQKVGEALLKLNRLPEARQWLESAIQVDPDNAEVLMMLGNCLLADHRPELAADSYRRILAQQPHSASAHHHLGLCLFRTGSVEAGLQHCLDAIRHRPDFGTAMFNAAVGYVQLGRFHDAKAMLRRALRNEPENEAVIKLMHSLWRYRIRHIALRIAGFFHGAR